MIKVEYLTGKEPVYDITVEGNHNFYANGILVSNCAEITLPTHPLKSINDGAPERKLVRMTKADYEKYKAWREANPKMPLPRN